MLEKRLFFLNTEREPFCLYFAARRDSSHPLSKLIPNNVPDLNNAQITWTTEDDIKHSPRRKFSSRLELAEVVARFFRLRHFHNRKLTILGNIRSCYFFLFFPWYTFQFNLLNLPFFTLLNTIVISSAQYSIILSIILDMLCIKSQLWQHLIYFKTSNLQIPANFTRSWSPTSKTQAMKLGVEGRSCWNDRGLKSWKHLKGFKLISSAAVSSILPSSQVRDATKMAAF